MRILINATTTIIGGGIQVSVNLIRFSLKYLDHDFCYLLSDKVSQHLITDIKNVENVHIFKVSPAKIFKGKETRKSILDIEKSFKPDIVYSVGSPSYVKFKSLEVMRLTHPWILKIRKLALSTYPKHLGLIIVLKTILQRRFARAEYYITQTNDAKIKIEETFGVASHRIQVIPNCLPKNLKEKSHQKKNKEIDSYKILCFSSPYPHKNIDIIPYVAKELKSLNQENFKFIVTLPEGKFLERFNSTCKELDVFSKIENQGYIKLNEVSDLYTESDILFLPTLLEVFSVTYLEASHYGLPIVTTDLPFSKDVCKSKAIYFTPKDSKSAARGLQRILSNRKTYIEYAKLSSLIQEDFENSDGIYKKHFDTLEKFFNDHKKNKILDRHKSTIQRRENMIEIVSDKQ